MFLSHHYHSLDTRLRTINTVKRYTTPGTHFLLNFTKFNNQTGLWKYHQVFEEHRKVQVLAIFHILDQDSPMVKFVLSVRSISVME